MKEPLIIHVFDSMHTVSGSILGLQKHQCKRIEPLHHGTCILVRETANRKSNEYMLLGSDKCFGERGAWWMGYRGETYLGNMVTSEKRISVQRPESKEGAHFIKIRKKSILDRENCSCKGLETGPSSA